MHAAWYQRPSLCHDRSACHDMSLSLVCAPSCRPAKICLLVSALLFHFLSLVRYKSLLKSKRAAVLLWLPEAAAPCWKNLEQEERKSRREMNCETGNKGRERWRGGPCSVLWMHKRWNLRTARSHWTFSLSLVPSPSFFFFFCLGDLVCGCKQQNTKWPLLPSADGAANMETRSLITESTEAITGRITSLLAGCSINWFWLETNGAAPLCFNDYSRYIQVKIIQSLMYSYFCVKERERLFIIIWHSLYSI